MNREQAQQYASAMRYIALALLCACSSTPDPQPAEPDAAPVVLPDAKLWARCNNWSAEFPGVVKCDNQCAERTVVGQWSANTCIYGHSTSGNPLFCPEQFMTALSTSPGAGCCVHVDDALVFKACQ